MQKKLMLLGFFSLLILLSGCGGHHLFVSDDIPFSGGGSSGNSGGSGVNVGPVGPTGPVANGESFNSGGGSAGEDVFISIDVEI